MTTPGVNAAFGQPLDPNDLALIIQLGIKVIRTSMTQRIAGAVTQFEGCPVRPLFLIPTPAAATACFNWLVTTAIAALGPAGFDVEVGNEPDLAVNGWGGEVWYAGQVNQFRSTLRKAGHTGQIFGGAVSNLQTGLYYLTAAAPQFLPDVGVSFHDYQPTAANLAAVKALAGARPIACTEFGWSSGPGQTDAAIATLSTQALALFSAAGVSLACYYQFNDGTTAGDQFGIRTVAGVLKPVASVFGGTVPAPAPPVERTTPIMSSLSATPLCSLLDGLTVHPQPDGTSTLSRPDGTVISCQPDGTLQSRPAGTAGAYEVCQISGSLATYHPDGVTAWRFAFSA